MVTNTFWACGEVLLPTQRLCKRCFKEASQDQVISEDVESYIKRAVEEGVRALFPGPSAVAGSSRLRQREEDSPEPRAISFYSEGDSEFDQDGLDTYSFDFSLAPSFISVVKQAIVLGRKIFSHLRAKKILPESEEIISKIYFS